MKPKTTPAKLMAALNRANRLHRDLSILVAQMPRESRLNTPSEALDGALSAAHQVAVRLADTIQAWPRQ